jgi:hypothetical protein
VRRLTLAESVVEPGRVPEDQILTKVSKLQQLTVKNQAFVLLWTTAELDGAAKPVAALQESRVAKDVFVVFSQRKPHPARSLTSGSKVDLHTNNSE